MPSVAQYYFHATLQDSILSVPVLYELTELLLYVQVGKRRQQSYYVSHKKQKFWLCYDMESLVTRDAHWDIVKLAA